MEPGDRLHENQRRLRPLLRGTLLRTFPRGGRSPFRGRIRPDSSTRTSQPAEALETNDSAVKVLGDKVLCTIARELAVKVRENITIDWTVRENVRANLRVLVKRILHKYGCPPDKQKKAMLTVLKQAELLSSEWIK